MKNAIDCQTHKQITHLNTSVYEDNGIVCVCKVYNNDENTCPRIWALNKKVEGKGSPRLADSVLGNYVAVGWGKIKRIEIYAMPWKQIHIAVIFNFFNSAVHIISYKFLRHTNPYNI